MGLGGLPSTRFGAIVLAGGKALALQVSKDKNRWADLMMKLELMMEKPEKNRGTLLDMLGDKRAASVEFEVPKFSEKLRAADL